MQQRASERHRADANTDILSVIPETVGPRLITPRGGAAYSLRGPGSDALTPEIHFATVTLAPVPGIQASLGSDRLHEYDASAGSIFIHPKGVYGRKIWSRTRETLIIALRPEKLLELAAREFDLGQVELRPPAFGTVDPRALNIARLLKAELTEEETPSEICVDSLLTAFSMHLLRNYSGKGKPLADTKGGLSSARARKVHEYLNENFQRKLSIAELAAVAGLTPFHFIRGFTKRYGEPPHRYILLMRLSHAERLLLESNMTIAEIAYVSGFSSQSHLTAMMTKHRHVTPAEIRSRR